MKILKESIMPAGPLMKEHRVIERMVKLMEQNLAKIGKDKESDFGFMEKMIDFMKTYADKCHHGKEEDILFRELKKKPLTVEHKRILEELINEHAISRKTLAALAAEKDKYASGDTGRLQDIRKFIHTLLDLYPQHIKKEDTHFFLPCMEYFTKPEQERMLNEFWEFDRSLIHRKYKSLVEEMESA